MIAHGVSRGMLQGTETNAVLTPTNGVRVGTYGRVSWGVRIQERSWSLDG